MYLFWKWCYASNGVPNASTAECGGRCWVPICLGPFPIAFQTRSAVAFIFRGEIVVGSLGGPIVIRRLLLCANVESVEDYVRSGICIENVRYLRAGGSSLQLQSSGGVPGKRTRLERRGRLEARKLIRASVVSLLPQAPGNTSIPVSSAKSGMVYLPEPVEDVRRWLMPSSSNCQQHRKYGTGDPP